jgi:hypothetical protein
MQYFEHKHLVEYREKCVWRFVNYSPSAYEKRWIDNIAELQHKVCEESNKELTEIEAWMGHLTPTIFSHFVFENNCTGERIVDYIEPLAGLTRSPRYCLLGDAYVVEKEYLHVSQNLSRKSFARSFYFDLGASMYNSGGGGASQSWFVETYGIHWDGIYAWEAAAYSPSEAWANIPSHIKPIYHWYNIPVNPEVGHPDNALEYIKIVTKPEDYVLLKIDIDNNAVEEALIRQLLDSKELMALVDELYFEHHVNVEPMHKYWGTKNSRETLEDTYNIFTRLRNNGILAHSWV